MSEHLIEGLVEKRSELERQVLSLQADIFHIDGALAALGRLSHAPAPRKAHRYFASGELIALLGEAERAGNTTALPIALHVMKAKGLDVTDTVLRKRIVASVKECRKRLNAGG